MKKNVFIFISDCFPMTANSVVFLFLIPIYTYIHTLGGGGIRIPDPGGAWQMCILNVSPCSLQNLPHHIEFHVKSF